MAATYYAQILRGFDWPGIVADAKLDATHDGDDCRDDLGCDDAGHGGSAWLGTVYALAPSGKFYMPWTSNQTPQDVDRDSRWFEALERVAAKFDGYIWSEGDDLYFMSYWPNDA